MGDAQGLLWVSTNAGLACVDPRSGIVRTYTREAGINGNEFNRYASGMLKNGMLVFEGVEGATLFDPQALTANTRSSPTVITELRLQNRPITAQSDPNYLHGPVERTQRLVLPYSERMVTFAFASLDHSTPAQNRFRYQLEGAGIGWVENIIGREATFTNLDPGRYTFQVMGMNSARV